MLFVSLALASNGVVDRIAAVVDEDVIALSEIYELGGEFIDERCTSPFGRERCLHEAELEILDALVKRALMRRELNRLKIDVTSAEVDQAIDSIVRDYGMADRTALRTEVEASGLKWDAYRDQLREQLQVQRFQQRVLAPRVSVSDDEVRDLYQRTARTERAPVVQLDAIGIVLPPDEEAQAPVIEQSSALVAALNSGEQDWEEAKALYDGAGVSKALGGRPYKKGQLTPQLDEVVFDAEVGKFLEPIRVGNVLMIARVESRETVEGEVKPFEEVQVALQNQLFGMRVQEAEEEWYQRARREAAVRVLLPEAG
ncbi:MAG: peptidyl-prolyl cis-trans isomerase [Alphaproteobacteria bacterium]|nr:peptidyl-prolyl cis-trans isomerase [Alphaproteobacteria bacterium]